jgi:ABC-type bacteriocin/lantibiotic exporter with double-glycine peptidase domain
MIREIYLDFYKKNKKYLLYIISILIYIPLKQVGLPHIYGKIISSLNKNNLEGARRLFLYLLIIWVIIQICMLIEKYGMIIINPKLEVFVEEHIYNKLLDVYNTNFQELKIGDIITKMIKIPWIFNYISDQFKHFFLDNSIVIISNCIYLFYNSSYLGWAYLIGMIFYILLTYIYNGECKNKLVNAEIKYDDIHEYLEDNMNNLIYIYTNNKKNKEKENFKYENKKMVELEYNKGICNLKYKGLYSIMNILLFIVLNYIVFTLYINKKIKLGALVSIFILNYNIFNSLIIFYKNAKSVLEVQANIRYISKFFKELLDRDNVNYSSINKINKNDDITIRIADLTYVRDDKTILDKVKLEITQNENIALIGSIGSGKSTIAKILIGLISPNSGHVYINGIPLIQYDINNIRKNIIFVPQLPILFNRTLWENLTYGLPDNHTVKPEDFYNIMNVVGLDEIKKVFEKRMHKQVGKKGTKLSGGQRQIVVILRALIIKCKVIILDEPTSSLDDINKNKILSLIKYICNNRTVIIISHDENILKIIDTKYKLENKKIIKI